MVLNTVHRLWKSFLELNLYKKASSDVQTAPKERIATRLYICSLAIVLLIITIVSAFILRTVHKIEYSPSYTTFSRLASKYPDTIHCPCSKIGITYGVFVTTHVRFHQVCSSPFIEQTWIDRVFEEGNNISLSSDDFRRTLSFFWQVIAGLCNTSNNTWIDIVTGFNASQTFNPVAIADNLIQAKVEATLNDRVNLAKITISRNLLAIRRVMSGSQLASALATNYYLRYSPTDSTLPNSPEMSPRIYDNCSCLHSQGCPHPATFNDVYGNFITIPGMVADCLIMDGTLASTLDCYYNQSCLSLLHPSLSKIAQPLSNDMNKHFMMNSTVEMLLNEIMIDEITSDIRFDLYYSQCNASYCSYSYAHRFDVLFIFSTLIGIFGGLSFVLRSSAPFIVRIISKWKNRHRLTNNSPDAVVAQPSRFRIIFNHIRTATNQIRQVIVNLNLFESQQPRTPTNIFREQLLTRLFILLLIISSIAAEFYTFFLVQNQIVTIQHPSLTTYEQLYNDYSDTLQCACSRSSVPYGTFLNVTFVLHQVCSSDLVSPMWLNYLELFDPIFLPLWGRIKDGKDFRSTGNSYFQLLATFCSLSNNTIQDAQRLFNNTQFINSHILAPRSFTEQAQTIIESYITTTLNDFISVIKWINVAFTGHYFLTGTNTNFLVNVDSNDTVTLTIRQYITNTEFNGRDYRGSVVCNCGPESSSCFTVNLLYTNGTSFTEFEQRFDELPSGCSPLTGFMWSKLSWWYNQTYIQNIQATYTKVIDWEHPPNIKPLNTSVPTQFTNKSLGDLVNAMFIELPIYKEIRFDRFYSQCAPISCSYTVLQRPDLIVAFFLLIVICDGIKSILKILVQTFGKVIFFLIDWWKNRNIQQPLLSTTSHLKNFFGFIYKSIINVNMYKTTSTDEIDLRQQRIHTRIYLILFINCLSVYLFYTAINERSITKTQPIFSIEDYEHLMNLYSDRINCPCSRISIPYKEFVTDLRVNAFHEACSTNLFETSWIAGKYGVNIEELYPNGDFRNFFVIFYGGVKELCTLAQESVNISIMAFQDSTVFINQTMPRDQFNNEINSTLNRFQEKTPIEFARTLNLVRTTVQGNALIAAFYTNWELVVTEKDQGRNASFRSLPITHVDTQQNTSCSCATSQTCTMPAQIFGLKNKSSYTIPGLRLGCYSLETVLQSSLSCFYSVACICDFRQRRGIEEEYIMGYQEWTGGRIELNSTLTRFNINDTVETLAYEMFIESWTSNISYERFFNSCAPTYCTYKIYYRFDALELLTTFLSVYSGLSLGTHFMVPHFVKIIKKIRNRFRVVPVQ